ncbi:YifB family Mg chelatase-like AAA ATPase [Sanguibacter sp. A247]|uniref:YifB family Mg chelatase-like AAA ATPase n=1 Tax=unclassified Sanguibacter TaxID=2645534 RepID=UPI003FD8D647
MGLGTASAVALVGMTGHVVGVEAHLAATVPGFALIGLPDTSLSESRDRVRAAVTSSGLAWPQKRVTVNLSPASLPKHGAGFDLAIAVAVLAGAQLIDTTGPRGVVHLGELGLDGRVHPVRGVLPAVAAAVASGVRRVVVAEADVAEARLVPGAEVRGVSCLAELAYAYGADIPEPPEVRTPARSSSPTLQEPAGDLADVLGQHEARAALEIAAAGGHHLLMVGPPGAGKTMLASRLPGLLPDLSEAEAVEVTAVHSIAGTFDPGDGLVRRPPYENPHHTATAAALVGGGSGIPRPGAASRAHRGVLFLDECPEFGPRVLQTLRQPLEDGQLVIHRAGGSARFPARFQLVLAANPCPCGLAVGNGLQCTCTPVQRRRYFSRIQGPLLDRVDLQVEVAGVSRVDLDQAGTGESSAAVAARVRTARDAAQARLAQTPWRLNGEVPGRYLRGLLGRGAGVLADVDRALDRGMISLRGADRVLRIAWTIADLAGRDRPRRDDVGRALALRTRGAVA